MCVMKERVSSIVLGMMASCIFGWANVGLLKELIRMPSVGEDIAQENRAEDCVASVFGRRGLFCTILTNPVGRKM